MRGLTKVNGNSEKRARVSDELRQLKLMSKGLRTQAMRSLLERHAAQRREVKPVALPPAKIGSVAA